MPTRTPSRDSVKRAPKTHLPPQEESVVLPDPPKHSVACVVGIGASAGGLEAFIELIAAIPRDTGMAFVLVQHLDPRHDSKLAGILSGKTAMPTTEIVDGMRVERNQIYVIPPDSELTLTGDVLRLAPRSPRVPHRPLDTFFSSLAEDRKSAAIGVVLSGSDSDGAAGLEAIREAGGITFAQNPESARFEAMPRAAAAAADFILPPMEIAQRLVIIAHHDRLTDCSGRTGADDFDRVLQQLRRHYPVDFSQFKRPTLERRMLRRVLLEGHEDLRSYGQALSTDDAAIHALYHDLLIGVTSFFRDPWRLEALKETVFPAIMKNRSPSEGIRVWAAGCSTGEEVYSLAMVLREFLDADSTRNAPPVTIYGTDINERSLAKARSGIYSQQAVGGVSQARLSKFFTPVATGFKISKSLRENCVFAAHDFTRDPPFSKIDLLVCSNVLIYFGPALQKKAVTQLQYALAPGGFLMLGSSENLRPGSSHLSTFSTKPLLYRRRQTDAGLPGLTVNPQATMEQSPAMPALAPRPEPLNQTDDDRFLATQLAPCGVLINQQLEITRIRGAISPFLSFEAGEASFRLFPLVRHPEVLALLRPAVRSAFRDGLPVRSEGIPALEDENHSTISFEVIPFAGVPPGNDHCWILFHGDRPAAPKRSTAARTEAAGLRRALAAAIDDREQIIEDAASAAEEAQSSDEELRSTNEELETAKEELQSANDELSTLNDELHARNLALLRMNDDIENLLGAVEIPILFAGLDLTIRRFNVTAGLLFNLRPEAVGRPLGDTRSTLDIVQLEKLISAVVVTGNADDIEVQDLSGEWRLLRIRPYRTAGGTIDGAIVAVVDIDALKRSVLAAEEGTRTATMLSEASTLLASSVDYETTLASLTELSTDAFADWCSVELLNDDGSIRHLTVAHANPVLKDLALQFQQATFLQPVPGPGAPDALLKRNSVLLNDIAKWRNGGVRPDGTIPQLIDALGLRSLISVPLIVRDKVLGTTTFASSKREYGPLDLKLAEDLAQRAAMAIDTAMLFRDAEHANRYKDEFLGTVAHELRTPLTSIIGWLQLAKGHPDIHAEALSRVEEGATLLRTFTEDLLDVTRIREQKLNMDMANVDLAAIVRSAIDITAVSATAREIDVHLELVSDRAMLRGDRVRLVQVVWNLLSNAIKFTAPHGRIDIRLQSEEDQARISVIDTGAGISPEFAPHVFELYRQADETAGYAPGLGIGLSIASQIVKLHGGALTVESPGVGRGSTFIVTLPLNPVAKKDAVVTGTEKVPRVEPAVKPQPRRERQH
jgi:two-component system CheB/CheR fusion protein